MRDGEQRTAKHVGSFANLTQDSIAGKFQGELFECGDEIRTQTSDWLGLADQKCSMQRPVCDSVGGPESPARKMRLNDFKAVGNPVNALENRPKAGARGRRTVEMKNDLRLNLRLGEFAKTAGL